MKQAQAQFNQLREVMKIQKYGRLDSKMKVLLRLCIGENVDGKLEQWAKAGD